MSDQTKEIPELNVLLGRMGAWERRNEALERKTEISDSRNHVFTGLNNVARFLKAIPDSIIVECNAEQCKIIADLLTDQAKRWQP